MQVSLLGENEWADVIDHPQFDNPSYDFRVKPEPSRCWRNKYADGHFGESCFNSSMQAAGHPVCGRLAVAQVEFVEVVK